MTPSDTELAEAVFAFRAAIDAAGLRPWVDQGLAFPRGACGHAAELLGRYLIQKFDIAPEYVNQWAHDDIGGWSDSHAWLEWNGITIDITGDQFGWNPVIVTRAPTFHGSGEPGVRHPVCLPHQANWWALNCGPLWGAISAHLPND
jgi:hypothetical protein